MTEAFWSLDDGVIAAMAPAIANRQYSTRRHDYNILWKLQRGPRGANACLHSLLRVRKIVIELALSSPECGVSDAKPWKCSPFSKHPFRMCLQHTTYTHLITLSSNQAIYLPEHQTVFRAQKTDTHVKELRKLSTAIPHATRIRPTLVITPPSLGPSKCDCDKFHNLELSLPATRLLHTTNSRFAPL